MQSWILFARTSVVELAACVRHDTQRVVRGERDYHALVEEEPGAQHSGERELARALSARDRVYVAYPDEDEEWIAVFERGHVVAEEPGSVRALAIELGCGALVPAQTPAAPEGLTAIVVAGVAPARLAAALDAPWPLRASSGLHLAEGPAGVVAWHDELDLVDVALGLSRELATTVYTVDWLRGREPRFRCEVLRSGEVVGLYDEPRSWWSNRQRVESIAGVAGAGLIATALGVVPHRVSR